MSTASYEFLKSTAFKDTNKEVDCHWFIGNCGCHSHDYFELFFITANHVTHTYLGVQEELYEREAMLIQPNYLHSIVTKNGQHFNISLSKEYMQKICNLIDANFYDFLVNNIQAYRVKLTQEQAGRFIQKINTCASESNCAPMLNNAAKMIAIEIVNLIYIGYCIDQTAGTTSSFPDWFATFLETISIPKNFCKPLKEIYTLSSYSQSVIINYFKKFLGQTPRQYILDLKINYAKLLLTTTNFSIATISNSINISSLSHFSLVFKDKTGLTPFEYRKKYYG